jgi:hypothetical protein
MICNCIGNRQKDDNELFSMIADKKEVISEEGMRL